MEPKKLKEIVLSAQRIHEESWIIDKVDLDGECISGHYSKDHFKSAVEAVTEAKENRNWAQVIYLLNYHAWNDIQDWEI